MPTSPDSVPSIAVILAQRGGAPTLLACLEAEGIHAKHVELDALSPGRAAIGDIPLCFVLQPDPTLAPAAESAALFRAALSPTATLVVCTPHRNGPDRQTILECGATHIVAPRSWAPEHVAERIQAFLIEAGIVSPVHFGDLHGGTRPMRDLYGEIDEVAPFPDAVLINGETGTGKELIARELHKRSRRGGELFALNCAELAPEVVESELFGHARNAFTGADRAREGLLVAAGEGTVFLDEIGDATPAVQAKLLRAVEQREVRPVGANRQSPIRARLVFGTHKDLKQLAETGAFRHDLFHRLAGVTLRAPPLRERRADIPLLANVFLRELNGYDQGTRVFGPGVTDRLMARSWPGNVRELRATIRREAMRCSKDGGELHLLSLSEVSAPPQATRTLHHVPFDPEHDSWADVEMRARAAYLQAVLTATGGDKAQAIARARIGRSQFYEHMKALRLKPE